MALQTYDVNVGSNFEFKMGDVIKLTLKDGYTFNSSVVPGVDDNFSTGPADPVQAGIADPSTGSLIVSGREYSGDNNSDNKFTPKYKITWNPVAIAAEGHNDGLDGLVDATKIQVLRNEVISAKNKIVVTKEKLAYYHNKVKQLLAGKGDIMAVEIGGTQYFPDNDGTVKLPGNIAKMEYNTVLDAMELSYESKTTPSQTTWDNTVLALDHGASTDGLTVACKVNGTEQFSMLLPKKEYVDDLAAACSTIRLEKVTAVPDAATASDGVIYLVPNSEAGANVYDEYFRVNKGTDTEPNYVMELFGTTAVDLDGYLQETDILEITNAEIDEIVV